MDSHTVLVVTGVDATADAVIEALYEQSVPVARFDLGDFPTDVSFSASWDGRGALTGVLHTPSREVDLARVRSLYYRRPNRPDFPGLTVADARFAAEQARLGFSGVLQSLPGCLYVNHPRRAEAAEWKPAQLDVAAKLGFAVPTTLITNQLDEARRFAKAHGAVVYKPMSFHAVEHDAIWVREVDPDNLDDSVAGTAHMFQASIRPKEADVRITVVGDLVFCVRIDSPMTDWRERYDLISGYQVISPPPQLPSLLRAYLHHWGLVYGCFDFGIDREGTWWWYECNPAGEWGWIAAETGLPIAEAFADLLRAGL